MKVFLIRHAAAVKGLSGLTDEHRYLTEEGRRTARAVGEVLKQQGAQFAAVATSPLVRATQTAELIAERVGFSGVIETLPGLRPDFPPEVVASSLASFAGSAIALVGHEPSISALGALLVSRPSFPPLRPGQVALLDGGRPVWTVRPDTLAVERLLVA